MTHVAMYAQPAKCSNTTLTINFQIKLQAKWKEYRYKASILELNHNSRQVAIPRINQKFSKQLQLESKDRFFMASYSCPVPYLKFEKSIQ